ncbi:MAG TPA: hypothetical protein VJT31_28475 [Rugosimonospora sp.]|nr:hypothetical protein [Rugosimonospora sp.]
MNPDVPDPTLPRPGVSPGWATAGTLSDLGDLVAGWLTGEYTETPMQCGPPDEETELLIPVLVAANRAGYVTDFSQPGQPRGADGWQQRAAVCGYCDEATRTRLAETVAGTELILLHEYGDSGIQVPVSLDNGAAFTWVGGAPPLDSWADAVSDKMVTELGESWYVTIMDPVWGRNDRLWPLLVQALGLPLDAGTPS